MPCQGRVTVKAYTTKKGKTVKPHTRACPAKKGKKANYTAYKEKQRIKRIKNRFFGEV
jgi:hypothetical protein